MLLQYSPDLLTHILSFLTPVQAFATLRSCRALRAAVEAAAREDLLSKRCGPSVDQLGQYLRDGKRPGDRVNLFVRGQTDALYTGVVGVRLVDGWRLDYLDGRPSETCLDSDESENLADMYGMYYKLRI